MNSPAAPCGARAVLLPRNISAEAAKPVSIAIDIEAGVPNPFSPTGEQPRQLRNRRRAVAFLAKAGLEVFDVWSEPTQPVSNVLRLLAFVFRHHDCFGFG